MKISVLVSKRRLIAVVIPCLAITAAAFAIGQAVQAKVNGDLSGAGRALRPWRPGILDIHHINTGRGNAAFFVFPDGTTMIVDAGAEDDDWEKNFAPLKLGPAVPNRTRRPGEWIADYIAQFAPKGTTVIDYALISHFHTDHFGRVRDGSPTSSRGSWKLAGITDVAERWSIAMMIDRAYPRYDFPVPLSGVRDANLTNYISFVSSNVGNRTVKAGSLAVGRDDQIVLKYHPANYPSFSVRNIAANGVVWTGSGTETRAELSAAQLVNSNGKFNENPLSIVIKLNYGDFDYVTGGDLTGVSDPDQPAWFNMESKIAPTIGEADVITLNHHGNRDATNADWLRCLQPRVIVQQTWVSDQPGGEVVARIMSRTIWNSDRDIFATHIQDATKIAIGPWLTNGYKSMEGHVVIRVHPGGDTYDVYILDDTKAGRPVKAQFGPYKARP